MLKQVHSFTTPRLWELAKMINQWIRDHPDYEIRDIKYNNCPLHLGVDDYDEALTEYSALVIYNIIENSLDERLYPAGR